MDDKLWFGTVHILEWLPNGDRRTGRELYDEIEPMALLSTPSVRVTYHRIATRNEFIATLRKIEDDFRVTGRLPLLQIETHGLYADQEMKDNVGICSMADDTLLWSELMQELVPLNQLTGLRLFMVMASCSGIWGIKMAQPVGRAPFLAILGPNRDVMPDEVAKACVAFYRTIFQKGTGNTALDAMNAAVAPKPRTFGIFNAEKLFTDVYEGYLAQASKPGNVEARVDRMMARGHEDYGPLPLAETERVRRMMLDYILDHPARFEEHRRHFFMIDLYPDNDARFNLRLERQEG
jgi:hypothetical protein